MIYMCIRPEYEFRVGEAEVDELDEVYFESPIEDVDFQRD